MGLFRTTGKILKPLVNFPLWMGFSQLAIAGRAIRDMARGLLSREQNAELIQSSETFEEAVQRLGLTEADILRKTRTFLILSLAYLAIFMMLLICSGFALARHNWGSLWLCSCLTLLALSLTCREGFYFFQMKQRRLGHTPKEALLGLWRLFFQWCTA